jgi:hypothetical protein
MVIYGDSPVGAGSFSFALNGSSIVASHGGSNSVTGSISGGLDNRWHVYAVRFSQGKGLSVFMDGVLLRTNADVTTPVSSFFGARIGCLSPNSVVRFRLAAIYGEAGSDQAILDQTTQIRGELGQ